MQTKLAPPRLHARLVERADLLAKLDEGLERKLTLLSAPAGFGKTTLVLRWLTSVPLDSRSQLVNAQGRSQPFCKCIAWLSLDSGDNDPVRFWGYAPTSCQRFAADLGAASLAQLRTLQPPSFESLLTIFTHGSVIFHVGIEELAVRR